MPKDNWPEPSGRELQEWGDEMSDEHGPTPNESTVIAKATASRPEATPCPQCGALGWAYPCSECGYNLSEMQREDLADEIELDLL